MKLSVYQGCRSVPFIISVFRIRSEVKADPDPAFQVNADPDADLNDPDPGFDDQKFKKCTAEKPLNF